MFTEFNVKDGYYNNLTLWDTHDIQVIRKGNKAEIVFHSNPKDITIRFANEPYRCEIWFNAEDSRSIDIGDESDWGEIDTTDHTHPKFGNDVDGYKDIVKVTIGRKKIPLEKFSQDVEDLIIFFEG